MKAARPNRLGLMLAALLSAPGPSLAHRGGIDPYGCHPDDKAGGYHCHEGILAGLSFPSRRGLFDAMDRPRGRLPDTPVAPRIAPPPFEALGSCSDTSSEELRRVCFERIAPPRK